MTEKKSIKSGVIPAIASTLAFAILPILISKMLALGFTTYQVMGLRFILAVPLGILYLSLFHHSVFRQWRSLFNIRIILLAGLFFLTALFMTIGLQSLDPEIGNVIFYTFPFMVLLVEVIRGIQRFSWPLLWSMLLIFAGIVILNTPQGILELQTGILWCLASGATYTAYLLANRVQQTSQFDSMVSIPLWSAGLSLLAILFRPSPWPACDGTCLWQATALAIVPTILALHLVNVALRTITASSFSVISSTEPLFVLLISIVISHHLLSGHEVVAFVMITIGSVVAMFSALPGNPVVIPQSRLPEETP